MTAQNRTVVLSDLGGKIGAAAAGGAPLGNTTEFASTFGSRGGGVGQGGEEKTANRKRLERFALQAGARELLPKERVGWCMRRVLPNASPEIFVSRKYAKAHYKNLIVCGSISCPVCAAKISQGRRAELEQAFNSAAGLGLTLVFVTLTMQHNKNDRCDRSLDDFLEAYRAVKSGRAWKEFASDYGVVGNVRALETTHGENGWHPHIHAVLFAKSVDIDGMREFLERRWVKALGSVGRSAIRKFAVVVKVGDAAISEYLSKAGDGWQLEDELARGAVKTGRAKGRTPFALLRDFMAGDDRSGRLYRQWAEAMKGLSYIRFSPGLRAFLGIGEELTDDDLANGANDASDWLFTLTRAEWGLVLRFDQRGELLTVAEQSGAAGVRSFLDVLQGRADEGERGKLAEQKRRGPRGIPPGQCLLCGNPSPLGHLCQPCRDANRDRVLSRVAAVSAPIPAETGGGEGGGLVSNSGL